MNVSELDIAIVKAIRVHAYTKRSIAMWASVFIVGDIPDVGRRLQSLRKRGIIEYKNGRWSAVESVT